MPERELTSELRHRQQQRRTTTTILVVILMLFFAFWYAYSYYRSSTGTASPRNQATCRPFDAKVATPANTTVNVYNATTRDGLAGRTAAALRARGYTVGEVSNDPLKRKLTGPAEVRFGPSGTPHAKLVLLLSGKGTTQLGDKRKVATVDLVLGSTFSSLAPEPKATGTPMCPSPTPSPSGTGSGTGSATGSAPASAG